MRADSTAEFHQDAARGQNTRLSTRGLKLTDFLDLDAARRRLSAERSRLEQALAECRTGAATVQLDQSSVGRLSRMDAMQQQAMAQSMLARTERRMRMLDAALARIAAGTYGLCCECGGGIEPERLAADPAVVFCGECGRNR